MLYSCGVKYGELSKWGRARALPVADTASVRSGSNTAIDEQIAFAKSEPMLQQEARLHRFKNILN